jgi:hypothetical protein
MVKCACGKPLDKLPSWMDSIKVEFVCNNCPNRQTKNIAFITLEPTPKPIEAGEDEIPEDLEGELDDDI